MKSSKTKSYIISFCIGIIGVLLIVSVINGINFGNFKILSLKEITSQKSEVKLIETNLELEKTKYDILKNKLELEKSDFKKEQAKYEAISSETVDIINKLNTKEKYSIEYIWIKLGNYATDSNISIVVAEPGNSFEDKSDNEKETKEENSIFKIKISGSYTNVAEFIYSIENDEELKFKLDNIKMEYVSGTTIRATFDVKDIVIVK